MVKESIGHENDVKCNVSDSAFFRSDCCVREKKPIQLIFFHGLQSYKP